MQREKLLTDVSVQPQSPELDAEQFPSNNLDDTTTSNHGETPMSRKFDFTSLVAAEKQQSIDDLAEYQTVLREIANDKCERTDAEILRLLERCGRDSSDLQSDVDWRIKRDKLIAEIKREEEYRTKNDELLAQAKAMREEFEKIETEYHATRNPLLWESNALDEKLRTIGNYRYDLYQSCRDVNLKLELEVLNATLDRHTAGIACRQQEQLGSEIKQLQYELDEKKIEPNRSERQDERKRKIKKLQEDWQKLELKKNELAQKEIEHQQAVDVIREKMIFS